MLPLKFFILRFFCRDYLTYLFVILNPVFWISGNTSLLISERRKSSQEQAYAEQSHKKKLCTSFSDHSQGSQYYSTQMFRQEINLPTICSKNYDNYGLPTYIPPSTSECNSKEKTFPCLVTTNCKNYILTQKATTKGA
jgi:hypothetical protein